MTNRTLAIGLDGFELSLAERLMSEGQMPNFAALRQRCARYDLENGPSMYTGLSWEHFSTGKTPKELRRFSAVDLDTNHYRVRQRATNAKPVLRKLTGAKTVVFDVPYCDLQLASDLKGLTNWGAHDPGVAKFSNPSGLHDEITERFGPYPATDYIYGFVWPDEAETTKACTLLAEAVACRRKSASWVLSERIPDWDLAIVTVSEAHSGIEMAWHGIDPDHPLKDRASAVAGRQGLYAIYREIDKLVGEFVTQFPDADIVVFSMHGMGTNDADVAAMALFPELLYRHRFGRSYMRGDVWNVGNDRQAMADREFSWHFALEAAVPPLWEFEAPVGIELPDFDYDRDRDYQEIEWMPCSRYQAFWPVMDVFAVPGFYNARARVNLAGREARGTVSVADYHAKLQDVHKLLNECRNLATNEPIVRDVTFYQGDPLKLDASEADMEITWAGNPTGLIHPELGQVGPVPWRRPGGHRIEGGFAWLAGERWSAGTKGSTSVNDIMPTLAEMVNQPNAVASMIGRPIPSN
ncbi:alkaline phosphatase family protein [Anderseniella sp. Alg231-50]|uniref:alkaline phosphatase family protein n=1 Tax=Anderseniella sp. Alg231-50 TaxID=1922226 RepID=UPI000D55B6DD